MAMAMARLAMRNLQQKVNGSNYSSVTNKCWRSSNIINNNEFVARFASRAGRSGKGKSGGRKAACEKALIKGKSKGTKGDFQKALEVFQKALTIESTKTAFKRALFIGPFVAYTALFGILLYPIMPTIETIKRTLVERWNITPWYQWIKSVDGVPKYYKLIYVVPRIFPKENVKITIGHDGVGAKAMTASIKGKHTEGKDLESGDGMELDVYRSPSCYYNYHDTSFVFPEEAEFDDVKAELKYGVSIVTFEVTFQVTLPEGVSVPKSAMFPMFGVKEIKERGWPGWALHSSSTMKYWAVSNHLKAMSKC